jgi:PAS domain S-box-containing protein
MAIRNKPNEMVMPEPDVLLEQRVAVFQPMLEISPDPSIIYDAIGQVVYVNPAFSQVFGWELSELIGHRLDFVPEERKEETAIAINALLQNGVATNFITKRLTKDGRVLDVQTSAIVLREHDSPMFGSLVMIRDITAQKEAERSLRASEIRYREMLESTPDAYYEVDLSGAITYYSPGLAEVLGYPEEELLGLSNRDYANTANARQIYEAFNQVYHTGQPAKAILMHTIRKDGTPQILETSIALRKDESGNTIGFRGIARDVTGLVRKRQEAEEALSHSEERYGTILQTIEDGYYETNLKGDFTFVNEQWAAIHGCSVAEMLGTNYKDYTIPDRVDAIYAQFNRVYDSGEPVKSLVNEIATKDGRYCHLEISASLVRDNDGQPIGFCGIGRDVTDRIQNEAQLRESEARYRTIMESIEDGYYEADLDGSFTFMNDQLCEVIGYPRHELMGKNYRDYTTPETAERVFATFNQVYKTGEPVNGFVWEAFGKDGRIRHLETFILPRFNEAGETIGFRGVGRDITQRVQAEEALAEALIDQERIASQLATVAKVSTAVSTILDPQEMLLAVVDQVKESFNLYHTHVYLLNEAGDTLELVAGAGEVGRQMVQEGRSIPLTQEQSLVARAARSRSGIIANDVRKDPHFLPHPLLPNTRAELAVPMIVGNQVLGVLDMQADTTNRFTQRYVNIQTTLATQIAVALQNARLYAQAQRQTVELQETSALLDQVVEILPVGLFMKEAENLRFVRWNKANEEITGLKHAEVIGKNDYDFFAKEQADFFTSKDREVLGGRAMVDIAQEAIDTAHRGQRLLHTRKLPILGADGTPRYLLGVSEDITERHQAEETLQASLALQQTLHDISLELTRAETLKELLQQAILLGHQRLNFDRLGLYLFERETRRFTGTFGTDKQGNLIDERDSVFDISEEDYLAQFSDIRQRVFVRHDAELYDAKQVAGRGWHLTVPLWQSDQFVGALFADNLVSQRPLQPYEPDLLVAYGSTIASLIERKQVELTLQETNTRAQAILESVTMPMLISRVANGRILYANELLADLVNMPLAILLEQGTPDFYVRADDRAAVVSEIQAKGSVTSYELELKRTNGEHFWALLSARLFSYQNEPAILTTLIDITERKQAQEAIRQSEQDIQESLRLQQTLHEVGLELAKVESLDELFRQAIVLGTSQLNFERIGLFTYNKATNQFSGTYGRDMQSNLRDEKEFSFTFPEEDFNLRFGDIRRRVVVERGVPLYDFGLLLGHGWHLTAPIWQNDELIGALFAQEPTNPGRPLKPYEADLLASYGALLANLIERLQNQLAVQESLRMQQTLHEINLELSQADSMDDLFRQVIHLGEKRLNLERFALFLYNEAQNNFSGTYGIDKNGNLRDEHGAEYVISVPEIVDYFRDTKQRILIQEACDLWDDGVVVGQGWLVTVPVRQGNRLVGILFTDNLISQRPLSPYLRDIVIAYSNLIANLMERKQAEGSVTAALAETERLYEMSARLNTATSISEIMEAVVGPVAGQGLAAANLFLLEVDDNGRPEWMEMAANWVNPGSLFANVNFPIGSRFYLPDLPAARHWIDNPHGLLLYSDVDHDDRLDDATRGLYQLVGIKAGANLPLRTGNRWVGLVTLAWTHTKIFTEDDLRTYRALADQTAIILNNQLLFEQTQKRAAELATVAEVGAAITTIRDVDSLLQRVVDLAKERFSLYHAHIYLLDESENLILTSGAGEVGRRMVAEGRSIPLTQGQSLVARAVRTRQGVIVNDVTADAGFLPHPLLPDTKSELAVPMIVGVEVLGVLDIQASRINHFSEEDIQTQTTLAAQIGVALQNARSFARSEAALKELEEITRRLRREGWESYVQTRGRNGLSYGYDQKEVKALALAASVKSRSRKKDTAVTPTLIHPLQVQGESIGNLMLAEPTALNDDAQDIMTAVAERLSAHIENLRLSEQTEQARQQAEQLFQGSAALNTAQTYEDVLNALRQHTIIGSAGMNSSTINYFDRPWTKTETPEMIEVLARWSRLPIEALPMRFSFATFASMAHLLQPEAPTLIADVANDKRLSKEAAAFFQNFFQAESLVFMPLLSGSQWVGFINAIYDQKTPFPEIEIRRLTVLSQQATVAIQSIRLFAQAQARAERERQVRTITDKIRRGNDREAILRIAREELSVLLGASKSVVHLGVPEQLLPTVANLEQSPTGHGE